jgi:hypothetical protein
VDKDLKLKRGSIIFCFRSNPFLKRVVITLDRPLVKLSTGKVAIKHFLKSLRISLFSKGLILNIQQANQNL